MKSVAKLSRLQFKSFLCYYQNRTLGIPITKHDASLFLIISICKTVNVRSVCMPVNHQVYLVILHHLFYFGLGIIDDIE